MPTVDESNPNPNPSPNPNPYPYPNPIPDPNPSQARPEHEGGVDGVSMSPSKVILSTSAAMGRTGRPAHAAPPSKPSQPYASKATPRARRVTGRSPQPLALCLSVARPLPALSPWRGPY